MIVFLHTLIGITVPALIPVALGILSLALGILSLALGILSLYLGFKAYRRKTGAYVRGVFTPCQSRACNPAMTCSFLK
jgi:hypothetical protein